MANLPANPSQLGFPSAFALEVALAEKPIDKICADHGIDRRQWDRLRLDPLFQGAVQKYAEELKADGVSFRMKARVMAEAFLDRTWDMVHSSDTPANVQADLIKQTWRVAGYDAPKQDGGGGNNFQINICLNGDRK